MADGVANAEALAAFAVEKNGEELGGDDAGDDVGDVGENAVEIEGFLRDRGDFEEEIQDLGTVFEADIGRTGDAHF